MLDGGCAEKHKADNRQNKRRQEHPFLCISNDAEAWRKRHCYEEGRQELCSWQQDSKLRACPNFCVNGSDFS